MTTLSTPLAAEPGARRPVGPASPVTFSSVLRAEWIKFFSVRSTWWTLAALMLLGAGLTGIVCLFSAEWLASEEADESAGSFVTWGMMVAQVTAVVLGVLAVTTEYGTKMIRSSLAAVPRRGLLFAAKATVLAAVLLVAGTVTAFAGYGLAKLALGTEDIVVSLADEGYLRSMFGSGLYLAALGLFSLAVGFLVRHTAAAMSIVLGLVFVVASMAIALPGTWGEWVMKLLPGNAGPSIATPVDFNPYLLDPWPSIGVFTAETAVLLVLAWMLFARRDA